MKKGQVLIVAKVSPHHRAAGIKLLEEAGVTVIFWPPYSPPLNPIELCWSKVKAALETAKARTVETLPQARKVALGRVTQTDAEAWFRHCL